MKENNKYIYFPLILIFSLYLFFAMIGKYGLDSDNYFMLAHGKYIIEHGFPKIEPFSIHRDFAFMIPQWLTAIVIYIIHITIGDKYIWLLFYFIFLMIEYLLYKILVMNSGNQVISMLLSGVAISSIVSVQFATRPFIITLFLITCELYLLEKYVKEQNIRYLLPIILISILQINFHNSLWPMLFIIMLPYFTEFILLKKEKRFYRISPLVIIAMISLFVGLLNPYGIDSITYIFKSMKSIKPMNDMIIELAASSIRNRVGILVVTFNMFTLFIILVAKERIITLRFLFLYMGTCLMVLVSIRNFLFFAIGMTLFLSDNLNFIKMNDLEIHINKIVKINLLVMAILMCVIPFYKGTDLDYNKSPSFSMKAIEWLAENKDPEDTVLYHSLNDGAYLLYKGFHPYIDARLEVYGKDNNEVADILTEYKYVLTSKIYYKDFITNYNFNVFLLNKDTEALMVNLISHDDDYQKIYEDDNTIIYEKK